MEAIFSVLSYFWRSGFPRSGRIFWRLSNCIFGTLVPALGLRSIYNQYNWPFPDVFLSCDLDTFEIRNIWKLNGGGPFEYQTSLLFGSPFVVYYDQLSLTDNEQYM